MIQTRYRTLKTDKKTCITTLYHNPFSCDAVIQPEGVNPESLHQHYPTRDTGS
jgi:hypothetical protein